MIKGNEKASEMTICQAFAMSAMKGLFSNPKITDYKIDQEIVERSVNIADLLIKKLNETEKKHEIDWNPRNDANAEAVETNYSKDRAFHILFMALKDTNDRFSAYSQEIGYSKNDVYRIMQNNDILRQIEEQQNQNS